MSFAERVRTEGHAQGRFEGRADALIEVLTLEYRRRNLHLNQVAGRRAPESQRRRNGSPRGARGPAPHESPGDEHDGEDGGRDAEGQ